MKKTIVISGGLGVLGQSFAAGLIQDGYAPIVLDLRDPKPGSNYVGEFFKADITNEEDINRLSKYIADQRMTVYGLINNASCQPQGFTNELEDYPVETFKKVLEVNLAGSFLLAKTLIPLMKQQHF